MSLLVAMPCYRGDMTVAGFRSLLGIAQACGEHGIEVAFLVQHGESAITRGRSNMLAEFLRSDKQTLLFLDADILIDPQDFLLLLSLEKPIRGAAVNLKTLDQSECLSCFKDGHQVLREKMPQDPFEVHYLGGSVMMIEREAALLICKAYEDLHYEDPIAGEGVHVFQELIVEDTLLSEDYAFCYRARECGLSIWCEPDIKVRHFEGRISWRH